MQLVYLSRFLLAFVAQVDFSLRTCFLLEYARCTLLRDYLKINTVDFVHQFWWQISYHYGIAQDSSEVYEVLFVSCKQYIRINFGKK